MPKTAVITGITGQDGAYLAELLLSKGYKVYGTYRRTSTRNFWRIEVLGIIDNPDLHLVEHDLTDSGDCLRLIRRCEPDEVYNLAAQSFVEVSFEQPSTTAQVTALGTLNMLEAIRNVNTGIRFYQASTSELFGAIQDVPQSEETRFYPRSPYGVAKLFGHWITLNYLESYGIFGCSGILFNHESPLRGLEFVTRKITDGVARIGLGKQSRLELGNLNARRDWGYAKDYVEGMYLMLQADRADNYVLATGRAESVRNFATIAFSAIGVDVEWNGEGLEETGRNSRTGEVVVSVDKKYYRPAEVNLLEGDPSKAERELGWKAKTSLESLCEMMVESDIEKIRSGRAF